MAGSLGRQDGGCGQLEQARGRILGGEADAETPRRCGPALLEPGELGVPVPLSTVQDLSHFSPSSLSPTPVNKPLASWGSTSLGFDDLGSGMNMWKTRKG